MNAISSSCQFLLNLNINFFLWFANWRNVKYRFKLNSFFNNLILIFFLKIKRYFLLFSDDLQGVAEM